MKKRKTFLFLLVFVAFFYFYLSCPKETKAAYCSSVTVSPGYIGSNTLTIQSNQIVAGEQYKINIDGEGSLPNEDVSETAVENVVLSIKRNFDYIGSYKIKLEYRNGDNICEGDVSIKAGNKLCDWEITPEKPTKDQELTVTVKNVREVIPEGDFQIKVVKPNSNEDGLDKNKATINYTPKEAGNYYFRLYSLKGKNTGACSINVFVGTTAEPGHIGESQTGTPSLGVYDLCQGEENCSNCIYGGGAWTALGCVPTDPMDLVKWLFPYLLGFGGLAAFGLIVFSGFQLMTSSGDPQKIQGAKETITSALTGLIFIILSLFLLRLIGVDILGLPGLE